MDVREIIDAILYVLRNACICLGQNGTRMGPAHWRDLPHDLPAWQTVYAYKQRFTRDETWAAITPRRLTTV